MNYDNDMIRTVARCMFIFPVEFKQTGYDWSIKQREWELLDNTQKQIWYDKAVSWLDSMKLHMPFAYDFYIKNWMPDLGYTNCEFITKT